MKIVITVVVVVLSLAVAPAMQADSLSDYCESERLFRVAAEQWAKDRPESDKAEDLVERVRREAGAERRRQRAPSCVDLAETARMWHNPNVVASTLNFLNTNRNYKATYAKVEYSARRGDMSVKALLLFVESHIYAIRAFEGRLVESAAAARTR